MTFAEIIQKLREKDDRVTQCFFFWDGPTFQRIEEMRRKDPVKASRMRRPICNTCKPALLQVLHKLYGSEGFDYSQKVSDFYMYIIENDKLATIREPEALMGWIAQTAYFFFLHEKEKDDRDARNYSVEKITNLHESIENDDSAVKSHDFVREVLNAMPNRFYAKLLDDVALEVAQYSGKEKIDKMKYMSDNLNIPIENLYVKISLAKKQFKATAMKLNNF